MRFPALDVVEHGLSDLDRRNASFAVRVDQLPRGEVVKRVTHDHDSVDRSLTKIGISFQRPLTFFFAMTGNWGWKRKALAASLASTFCASPKSLFRSATLPV